MRYSYVKKYKIALCPSCSESHAVKSVEFVNISTDLYGRDLMEFICPNTKESASSIVVEE